MKVTQEQIDARIKDVRFTYDGTLTICVIELDNGWKATGESACVDPAEYNRELGEVLARSNAMCKIWGSMGFALAESRHMNNAKASTYGATQNAKPLTGEDHGAETESSQRFGADAAQGSFEASLMSPNAKTIEPAA